MIPSRYMWCIVRCGLSPREVWTIVQKIRELAWEDDTLVTPAYRRKLYTRILELTSDVANHFGAATSPTVELDSRRKGLVRAFHLEILYIARRDVNERELTAGLWNAVHACVHQ